MVVEWVLLDGKLFKKRIEGERRETGSNGHWSLWNRRGEHVCVLRRSRLGHRAIRDVTVGEQMELRGQIPGLSSDNHLG